MDKKPNIVWFVADQMRCDAMRHMGNPAASTPNLDALAGEGVSFRNAYCQNPVCVPSRCSFLTGLYPHTLGHRTMHFLMRPEDPNILKTMKQNGYEVIWIGRNDFIPSSRKKTDYCDQFFDGTDLVEKSAVEGGKGNLSHGSGAAPEIPEVMRDVECKYAFFAGRSPEHSLDNSFDWNCINAALNYLEQRSKRRGAKPFFLYCTLIFPHPPYGCEEPWYSLIDREALPPRRPDVETLPGKADMLREIRKNQHMQDWREAHYNELRAVYLGMAARFDYQLGLLISKLKETDVYDDTSLFVFSDHGDLTGDYGIAEKCQNCFEDPLTNVPLLVKPAKGTPVRPGISEALVELADLPATVCQMAGIEIGYRQFGKPLTEALNGGAHRGYVFCEGGRLHGEPQAMEPEHPETSPYWPRISVQHREDIEAHTKACMLRQGNLKYILRLYGRDELYDLAEDPMECENRAGDARYAPQIAMMRQTLLRLYMETADYVPPAMDKR